MPLSYRSYWKSFTILTYFKIKIRIIEELSLLLTCAASFSCQLFMQLTSAANLSCHLGILAFAGFEPGTAALYLGACLHFPVLEMHNSWKEIYIFKMNLINLELNF
jgi:hypothetical protein